MKDLALHKMSVFEDGTPICVARPSNPERAMEIALGVGTGNSPEVQKRWDAMHDKLNEECGPYTFVGYMGIVPKLRGSLAKHRSRKTRTLIVNEQGEQVGICEPGDSFVRQNFWDKR